MKEYESFTLLKRISWKVGKQPYASSQGWCPVMSF
jgi:hypothetical protein